MQIVHDNWSDNNIQFPRLLAEISANIDISDKDWNSLCQNMDLESEDINEIFDRASAEWEKIKSTGAKNDNR